MIQKYLMALHILPLGLLISACAFQQEKELGETLKTSVRQQQVSNGAKVFENSAYEMQRGMNYHYGARSAPKPIEPSLNASSAANLPEN